MSEVDAERRAIAAKAREIADEQGRTLEGRVVSECKPPIETFENDFHEVWWCDADDNEGHPTYQLHEVWQWLGDAPEPGWERPGYSERTSAEEAYAEGWRYVRPIKLLDEEPRMDGEPPRAEPSSPDLTLDCAHYHEEALAKATTPARPAPDDVERAVEAIREMQKEGE
jgi:hypothetical protein